MASWQPPSDYRKRPVAVLGGGVLGRRIGCIWASAGYDVNIRDPSSQQRADAIAYIEENVHSYAKKTQKAPGATQAFDALQDAVKNAWLVIEAIPEKINFKIDTFAELAAVAPTDCILASNSSSYKSSEMLQKVPDEARARILNMHYYMPPQCMIVELMTDGHTAEDIITFLVQRSKEAATLPYVARKESTGFIFNRIWAAVKREILTILAEGVSVPEEIDSMWTEMFIKSGVIPCRMMDNVGLDTVAFIEQHYIDERGLSPEKTVDFLRKNYLDNGKLGAKCSKGGLYPPEGKDASTAGRRIIALDIGLSAEKPTTTSGEILELSTDGKIQRVLAKNQSLPDGIDVDYESGRMFWTCMGVPGNNDGTVYSAGVDGTDIKTIVAPGGANTPKQLALDRTAKKIYFCDREGLRVFRCNYDGSNLETLIKNGDWENDEERNDGRKWCVGVAVAPKLGKFYWTQKGFSKSGKGRIFSANIETPSNQAASSRSDIECILSGLPEPIDLEVDEESRTLYWTDRGEVPLGNALYRTKLDADGSLIGISSSQKYEVITRHMKEAIGLKLDHENRCIYLTDLGGNIYRYHLDGGAKEKIHSDDYRAFTGIALL
ncbi:hypothetical protein C8Q69DRAFT_530289 [Paecilomyces variotii]|uniref:Uncharacterized protein n=1 Tax=Byssochlamys spectabilis TaxID=264951 RepID=A0A443HL79_BYSSP|nr:hypothetical protein C8Q69DRAFT_530289 [Paecilomyces variotii]KAJ9353466.1 hypothetical protein DTO280E4_7289 [Paecilomyces variotii]KAJ9372750.1 hypothetical protein DTO282E5_2477 [Paecilomyces variotii]RWQ92566.1 hypothetical protein C8Q69DRAFT_530289 [Paecilomyces variotii]